MANKIQDIEDIKGVGDKTASKLRESGFTNIESIAITPVRELMEKTQDMFPARAVKPRDEWQATVSANVPIVGKLRIKYDLELEDVEQTPSGKIAIINFKGKVDSAGGGTIAMGPVSVRIKSMDMDQEGVMRFNIDTGMMVSQKIEQDGTIEMSMQAPGKKSVDATTDIEQTIDMAVTKE